MQEGVIHVVTLIRSVTVACTSRDVGVFSPSPPSGGLSWEMGLPAPDQWGSWTVQKCDPPKALTKGSPTVPQLWQTME